MNQEQIEKAAKEYSEDRFPTRLYGDHIMKRSEDDFLAGAAAVKDYYEKELKDILTDYNCRALTELEALKKVSYLLEESQ